MGPSRIAGALVAAAALLVSIWLLEGFDFVTGNALDGYGITPRRTDELPDVFFAPFLHAGFAHVMANSIPLAVLGFLTALRGGVGRLAVVTLVIILIGGFGVWLTAPPNTITLGASILVFGYFGYLVARGFIDHRPGDIVVAVVVGLLYGTTALFGVLPSGSGVSWQGHLFGLVGGVLAAWLLRRGGAGSWPAARGDEYGGRL
ncbi:MAG: rhomboid family intramembrane serine protease [Streptosporangiales bacterium]|nr:rhomboid family intramembrane serine protease [Streptosporangiales bacterium]